MGETRRAYHLPLSGSELQGTLCPMLQPEKALGAYTRILVRAARGSVSGLMRQLELPRAAAGEIYAATAALLPEGLGRRTRRRPDNERAAMEVVKKFGRPADVQAPELGIASRVDLEDLSPRLGGLLGDAGPGLVAWISERTGADADAVGKGIAVTAPIVLGALDTALEPRDLGDWVSTLPETALDAPTGLPDDEHAAGSIYRRLERYGRPWWRRWSP